MFLQTKTEGFGDLSKYQTLPFRKYMLCYHCKKRVFISETYRDR